jgi:metal-dependent amidase/aminoacylase/carboxypeptidase family protein
VVHIKVGERAFGTTPGHAVVCATLRAYDDIIRDKLQDACFSLGRGLGTAYGLEVHCSAVEPFPATSCAAWVVSSIQSEARAQGLEIVLAREPFPWSEDFGHFTARYPGALFGLGAGMNCPALHHPTYEFPDELLDPAATLMEGVLRRLSHSGDGEK